MNKAIFLLIIFVFSFKISAQNVNTFIQEVLKNHPYIVSGRELLSSKKAESKTGLTPPNPNISVGYFPGIPETIGDKVTWSVSQTIDFPTFYRDMKIKKEHDYEQAVLEYRLTVIRLLQEAREKAIKYIALQNHVEKTENRIEHLNKLEESYAKMLKEGEATVIEYNKIGLDIAAMRSELMEYESEEQMVKSYLDLLSSNNSNLIEGYPVFEEPDLASLIDEKKKMHPSFMIPEKEIMIAESNMELVRSEKLPAIEIGFASEIIAANQFTGPRIGLSVPLWQNKGRMNKARADHSYSEMHLVSEVKLLENNIKSMYDKYLIIRESLEILKRSFEKYTASELLLKALKEREISLIEYFTELRAYYDIEDRIIETEKNYYIVCSRLYDHFPDLNFQEN